MKDFIKLLSVVLGFSLILSSCNLEDNHVEFSQPEQVTDYQPITEENEWHWRDGQIVLRNACVCSKGESIGLGPCDFQCMRESNQWDENKYLVFGTTSDVGASLYRFCNTQEGDTRIKSCLLEFKDEDGNIQNSSFEPSPNNYNYKININNLLSDETYRVRIKEITSDISSTTLQFRFSEKTYVDESILNLMPVSSYTCTFNPNNYKETNVEEFYFISENRPEPLLDFTMDNVLCHSLQDSPTPINYPLQEETAGVFNLWNKNDPRFFDLDGDGKLEIHNNIEKSLSHGGYPPHVEIFHPLSWATGLSPSGQEIVENTLGYFMVPLSDPNTLRMYCPQREHFYQGYGGLLTALRPYIDMDTEGIYLAKEEGHCNQILAPETTLKQIAFYEDYGNIIPTQDLDDPNIQVKFYWPADLDEPFIKNANQKIFILKMPGQIPSWCSPRIYQDRNMINTKILGCAPKLNDL